MSYFGSKDLMMEIALGNVTGVSHINKFGHNPDVDTATDPEDVTSAGGLYVPPTEARIHDLVSTDAQDAGTLASSGTITTAGDKFTVIDSSATFVTDGIAIGDAYLNDTAFDHSVVASIDSETQLTLVGMHDGEVNTLSDAYRIVTPNGTGTAVVHIKNGLDANFDFQGEFIIMNGLTNVPTLNSYVRINRIHADLVGTSDSNVGDITATAQTDTTVTAHILAGSGQTLMAHFTIPRNKIGLITGWNATLGKAGKTAEAQAEVSLRYSKFSPVNSVGSIIEGVINLGIDGSGYVSRKFEPYKVVKEYTDVFVRCDEVTDDNSHITAEFDIILVDL